LVPHTKGEHGLRVSQKRVLRRILDLKGSERQKSGGDCITRSFKGSGNVVWIYLARLF